MKSIIIDTDPGVDDLFAILMALGSEQLRVQAITTTPGNVGIDLTTRNASRILSLAQRHDIPVYRGAAGPLSRPLKTATQVHGEDGLHGMRLPEPLLPARPEPAVDFLCQTALNATPGSLYLACLGPLTNLALALEREPAIAHRYAGVIIMGGGFGTYRFETSKGVISSQGNVTPNAEFNIYADPEAAHRVATSALPLVWLPLDITHQTLISEPEIEALRTLHRAGPALSDLASAYGAFSRQRWGTVASPLHDANVISYLEDSSRYALRRGTVRVSTTDDSSRGQVRLEENATGDHQVALQFDASSLFPPMMRNLERVFDSNRPG
jgi:purine nucleosidase